MSAPLLGVWYPHVLNERLPAWRDGLEEERSSSSTRRSFWPPMEALPTLGNDEVTIGLRDATDTAAATSAVMSERSSLSAKGKSPYRRRRTIIITTLGVAALVIASALLIGAEGVGAGALVVVGVWLAGYWRRHSR